MLDSSGTRLIELDPNTEQLFRSLAQFPIGTALLSLDGKYLRINKAFCNLFGYTEEELLALTFRDLILPEDLSSSWDVRNRMISGEYDSLVEERRYVHKSGQIIWGVRSASIVRNKNGDAMYFFSQIQDTTVAKETQVRLQRSEANLAASQRIAHLGSWDLTLIDGAELREFSLYCSDEVSRIWGFVPGEVEVTFDNFFAGVHPRDRDGVKEALENGIQDEREFSFTHRIIRPDGCERIVHHQTEVQFNSQTGKPDRLIGTVQDITEQVQAEEFNAQAITRLREAQSVGKIGDWECDIRLRNFEWSPLIFKIFRCDPGQGSPRVLQDHSPFLEITSYKLLKQALENVLKTGEPQECDLVGIVESDERVYIRARALPRKDSDGNVVRIMGTFQDVTSRKRAYDNAIRLAAIVESSDDAIIGKDLQSIITSWNPGAERLFGYTSDEMVGQSIIRLIPENRRAEEAAILRQVRRGKPTEKFETQRLGKDGRVFDVSVMVSPIKDSQGTIIGASKIAQNITEVKRAKEELKASQEHFRTMVDAMAQLAWMAEPDGSIFWYNQRWIEYTGLDLEDMRGWGWEKVHDPNYLPKVLKQWTEALTTKEPLEMEFPLRGADGNFRWFLTRVIPLKDSEGNVLRWFGTNTDVSERHAAETEIRNLNATLEARVVERTQQLEKANEELLDYSSAVSRDLRVAEAADRIKTAFLATMSHELRTPLNSILGFTGIVLQGLAGPLNEEQKKQLGMVRGSAKHLLELINDVLDISKIEAGQLEVRQEAFQVWDSIQNVMSLVQPLADAKSLTLTAVHCQSVDHIMSDRRRFEQILLNLLGNAIKFTEAGSVTLTCNVLTDYKSSPDEQPKKVLLLQVKDSGIGMSSEDLSMIFQPFKQIDSGITRQNEGTGLGLAISRRLATLLGGELYAVSERRKGSEFNLILPLEDHSPT